MFGQPILPIPYSLLLNIAAILCLVLMCTFFLKGKDRAVEITMWVGLPVWTANIFLNSIPVFFGQ